MFWLNNVMLIGRLTKDPELRYVANSGTAIATFTLAVDKQVSREKKQEMEAKGQPTADFIRTVVWGRQAESCAKHLAKGLLTAVQGRIQTGSYDDKDGKRIFTTDVVAERVQFLEWADRDKKSNSNNTEDEFPDIGGFNPTDSDNIPF